MRSDWLLDAHDRVTVARLPGDMLGLGATAGHLSGFLDGDGPALLVSVYSLTQVGRDVLGTGRELAELAWKVLGDGAWRCVKGVDFLRRSGSRTAGGEDLLLIGGERTVGEAVAAAMYVTAPSPPGMAVSWAMAHMTLPLNPTPLLRSWRMGLARQLGVRNGSGVGSDWCIAVPDTAWLDGDPVDRGGPVMSVDGLDLLLHHFTKSSPLSGVRAELARAMAVARSLVGGHPVGAWLDGPWLPSDIMLGVSWYAESRHGASEPTEAARAWAHSCPGPTRWMPLSLLRTCSSRAKMLFEEPAGGLRPVNDVLADFTEARMAVERGVWVIDPTPDFPLAQAVTRERPDGSWAVRFRRPLSTDTLPPRSDIETVVALARKAGAMLDLPAPDPLEDADDD